MSHSRRLRLAIAGKELTGTGSLDRIPEAHLIGYTMPPAKCDELRITKLTCAAHSANSIRLFKIRFFKYNTLKSKVY